VTRAKPKQKQSNQLRIIGGEWRGRKLAFPDLPGLRPTSDRVRETLFNWLQFDVMGAKCLDLFAGSGALGLEALSRGAALVTFVDAQRESIAQLKLNLQALKTDKARCIEADAIKFLERQQDPFDIIFLDPPFQMEFLPKVVQLLASGKLLKSGALIYLEMEKNLVLDELPDHWLLSREKTAGQVRYMLFNIE